MIWHSSHALAAVPCVLNGTGHAAAAFLGWYFDELDAKVDAASGFWTGYGYKPPASFLALGASFHMLHAYHWFGRPWKHRPAILANTLRLQQPNGFWQANYSFCPDVDGVFTAAHAATPSALAAGVREACTRYLAAAEATLNDAEFVMRTYTSTHPLHGALLAIRECQAHFPELVVTASRWRNAIDDACFY